MAELTGGEHRDGYVRDPEMHFAGAIHDGREGYVVAMSGRPD